MSTFHIVKKIKMAKNKKIPRLSSSFLESVWVIVPYFPKEHSGDRVQVSLEFLEQGLLVSPQHQPPSVLPHLLSSFSFQIVSGYSLTHSFVCVSLSSLSLSLFLRVSHLQASVRCQHLPMFLPLFVYIYKTTYAYAVLCLHICIALYVFYSLCPVVLFSSYPAIF